MSLTGKDRCVETQAARPRNTDSQDVGPRMKLIVGLGNPGPEYAQTRHNVGFMVIDQFLQRWPQPRMQQKFAGLFCRASLEDQPVGLLKPTTSMNLSGIAVDKAMKFYKLPTHTLLVIADDLALPPGRLRLRRCGSSGGHKGLASVAHQLATDDFARLRIGIGPSDLPDPADYVLSKFSDQQWPDIAKAIDRAVDALSCWLIQGIDAAMNKFNAAEDLPSDAVGQ